MTTCPSCGSAQDGGVDSKEEPGTDLLLSPEEGAGEEGVALEAGETGGGFSAAKGPAAGWREKVPWNIILDAAILLLVAAVVLVLVFTFVDWGGSGGPEGVAVNYYQAVGENRAADLVDMLDPLYLENVAKESNTTVDELKAEIVEGSGAAGMGNVAFEGLTFSTTTVEYATVEVTGGEVTVIGEDGQTSSMSMEGQTVTLIKRDGTWYLDGPSMFGQ